MDRITVLVVEDDALAQNVVSAAELTVPECWVEEHGNRASRLILFRTEAAAGILLIIGYQTRIVALAIAAFCVVAALLAHTNIADGNQLNHLLKNLAVAGGALSLFASGPGGQSVDAKRV